MDFDLETAVPVLERTPRVLRELLSGLPTDWLTATEGPDTWNPYDVVGHLIHGERTDWIPRIEHILAHGDAVPFPSFDRFAQFEASRGQSLGQLLDAFAELRAASLDRLAALQLTATDLDRPGLHPALGRVTLGNHLASWVVHDLDHIYQVVRAMAGQYADAVGPWREYLRIVRTP
ncbi:MAG: DinB family protein [Gemmatimonadota bacterium]|nr:DinB family protein [Gemmatimonadota bacterium]